MPDRNFMWVLFRTLHFQRGPPAPESAQNFDEDSGHTAPDVWFRLHEEHRMSAMTQHHLKRMKSHPAARCVRLSHFNLRVDFASLIQPLFVRGAIAEIVRGMLR